MKSLQSRLSTGLLLSLIIAFSALGFLVSINIQHLAEDYIASRLKHDAENLLSSINFNNNGELSLDMSRIDLIYNQPFSGHYFVITANKQSMTSRSLWDQTLKQQTVATGQQHRTLYPGPEQQSLLLLSTGYKKQGHQLIISIAEDLNPINKNILRFKYTFAALAIGMLLTLVILQSFILRKSLAPLTKIQDEIKALQQGERNKLSTDFPGELQPLINEVNHLLDIMQQRLTRSRNASGDLAHAIKKPLTVIKQISTNSELPETIQSTLTRQADEIYQITERTLKRARLAGHAHSGALFSFTEDLPALVKTLDMMYADKALQTKININHAINCQLDREDMLELLGNLLDNAYKWAAKKIIINVKTKTDLYIEIEDDGPGADPEKIHELSKRGVRLDEKIAGHGLGLAIAADTINDYSGRLTFSRSKTLGGFKAEIMLPLQMV